MRKLHSILLPVIIAMLIIFTAGCGQDGLPGADGEDGSAYIAYSWAVGPITFYTEDPAFTGLSYIVNGEYLLTVPGTYYFEYIAWDDSYWVGTYTIYINEGEPGSPGELGTLFQDGANGADGADGEDIYFELACYSTGPTLWEWTYEYREMNKSSAFAQEVQAAYDADRYKPASDFVYIENEAENRSVMDDASVESRTQILNTGVYTVILTYKQSD